ncbi:MAG TPA: response regulator [Candidatus Sumerlaeota bacterium]|jgi:CheY-like chemotaxis protein|nr:MAG: Alkaline phosphatase synthesis transcriptional regulatory protein PhoP [candidate division BRC1 bacterium ADurb.Bin183]HOE64002.1 response regulator [Candidatus Sumerlaeota bacterium]HRR30463.1 response regulator [Candidatus Sumerlaeia bacterium]HON51071.1 response regulator [Candidatus Sumerlaeota bacterium]HOR65050.1 response regulator [Candidatus Sumerlaeota bacterium]
MPKKILAIDDENDVLLIIKTALLGEGYDVITASNGYDGLALAEDQQPDLILLDLRMPEMDGMEVLQQLRNNEKTENLAVIILTGISDKKKIREALDKGITYYIVKPFECQDLISKINLALQDIETNA